MSMVMKNWRWFASATDKQKVAWAKKQWKQKGKNPIAVSVDQGNFGVYMTDGHHRLRAATLLGLKVPIVIERTSLPYEEAKRIIVENIPTLYNPRRRNGSTRLVPKEQVRMVGFCPKKTKVVQPEIKHALALIEKIEQRKILFPTPIRPMTKDEFMDGRSVVDNGHPRGAGHGQYDPNKQEVAVNGNMQPFDLIANIFHENLHHARPDWSEEQVRDLTGEAMLYLYGEYNLGKPYAEGRLEAKNFRRNRSTMAKKETRDSKGRLIPQKYLVSYKGKQLQARIKELEQRRDEYAAALKKYGDEDKFPKSVIKKLYRPFKTDKGKKGKRSKYTIAAEKRGFVGSIPEKAKAATRYYGGKVDASILKEVNKRGMAAWASGGHRAGQTSHSWGIARVNSFLTGGKTFFTADKKLAEKLPSKVRKAIEKERTYIA